MTPNLVTPTTDHQSCRETDTETRFRLRKGVLGTKIWHSQFNEAVPYPAIYRFARRVSSAICESAPETPNSAVWCGAVGFLRVRGRGYQLAVINQLTISVATIFIHV